MAIDPSAIMVTIPREDVEAALAYKLVFDALTMRERRILRSPDRKLYIISEYCSLPDLIEVLRQWQQSPPA